MRLVEHFGSQSKMQFAGGDDFQAIIVQSHSNRARSAGIIAMDKCVGKSFAHCIGGERRRVDASHLARHDFASHREPINQKTFGPTHQRKSVAGVLPVVEKFVAVCAFESGNAKHKLRECWQNNFIFTKQGNGST